ncbi:flavohemoglobin expression-modulating QEGLA motif protein [Spongiivirga sp. MCCC 1A20706]|uniref:flavohemoglobin expression-modulating QEGLA motif protein n=1 Tax=Spongiivirga sp. MCCC 1A20706 TaxID=3160963 RepID=UPI003977CF67
MKRDYDVATNSDLFDIDNGIHRLVQKIELLNYVNPINIEQEKRAFFASKYRTNPVFKYPKLKFDAYKLQRLLFSMRLERIDDDDIRALYRDIIYDYSALIECIDTIGKGKDFYYNSLKSFGTPTERDVENARFILHFEDDGDDPTMIPAYDAIEAEAFFRQYGKEYGFDFNIKLSTKLSASAMVLNNTQTLVLKKNAMFSANMLNVLANHEIGVHMVTTFNGLNQPLKIFSNGLPKNVETQEGLAVFSEYMSGSLTMHRLKELAYRVLAADSLLKGYNFCETFDLLHSQYKVNKEEAFTITLRVHRGGGFTKDYLYLTGLKKVYDHYHSGKDLNNLLTGKVTLAYLPVIEKLQARGLANPSKYLSNAFKHNDNLNKQLDFILKSLK